ncbi:ATP-dependent Clp protease, ATP-binding subunit ClpC [hydrothermal vent metagenome]|uniref:ATP-dependent Clp protease, ATP-binding subunit ClpC n=1 Tax=hydrothermal vent metagenome TaxID=652676 RepID=A0A3B1DAE6_9ZZZZ
MFKRFTERARKVIILAREEAEKNQHEYLGTEHILLGVLKDAGGVAISVLQRLGVDIKKVRMEAERNLPASSNTLIIGDIPFTSRAKKVLEYSVEEARAMGHSYIGTEHLLLGLVREKDGVAARVLSSLAITYAEIREQTINLLKEPASSTEKTQSKTPALDEFGRDLTDLGFKGKLDPVIGRAKEIERVIQILARRTKNNPVLIGEPGVGKTAIVEGLAQLIITREVPQLLYDKRVVSLDLGAVIAGTKYRGQFEQRIKAIMKEITQSSNVILFIDEIHTLVGAGAAEGSVDASNMLKPALSRGEIQCIGATTLDEYRKYIEKNGALERRFQPIIVQPPGVDETIEIIRGLRSEYENHHKAHFTDEAIITAVRMSDRYMPDRFLPDKAIDVIDETGSRVHLSRITYPPEIRELQQQIDDLVQDKKERIEKQEFEKAVELRDKEEECRLALDRVRSKWEAKQESSWPTVSEEDIAHVVSTITGIPLSRIEKEESQKLQIMADELRKKIFGQDEAIEAICKAIRRSRMGLKDITKPMGTFLFLGPTGVGKTELANILAEYLFDDRASLIRLDMSEYMEKFNASKLVGAPPGYVGYEEGGQLTERVRRRPYAVVLLDEIEKAHADIYHMLLQIMDDGRLTDSYGRHVSFKNVILIMTSNLSARIIEKGSTIGFHSDDKELAHKRMEDGIKSELKKTFNPEFINRIDEVVTFRKLVREDLAKIVVLQIDDLRSRLSEEGIGLVMTDDAIEYVIDEGYDPVYGARPLKRAIQRLIENPLSEEMLFGKFKRGSTVSVRLEDNHLVFHEQDIVAESI